MSDNSLTTEPGFDTNETKIDIKEIIGRYLKYLPWIILFGILGFIAGYIKLRYAVPMYKAQSAMLIQANGLSAVGGNDSRLGNLFMSGGASGMNLANEIQILQSRPMLRRVARNLNLNTRYYSVGNVKSTLLYNNSPIKLIPIDSYSQVGGFNLEVNVINNQSFTINSNSKPLFFGQPFEFNKAKYQLIRLGNLEKKGDEPPKFLISYIPEQYAAEVLKGAFSAARVEGTDILTLNMISENKELCKDVLTNTMAVYDSLSIEDRSRVAQITLQFIDDRLDTVKNELSGVEKRLQDFMEKNNLYDLDAQASNYLSMYNEYFKQQSSMNVQVSILNWLSDYLKNKQNKNKIVPTSLGISEPALNEYIINYNRQQQERESLLKTIPESNPVIQKQEGMLEKMRGDMIEALNNVKASYNITDNSLRTNTRNAENELQTMPMKARQMLEIKRRQQIMQDLYSFLLQKKIEVSISSASTISVSRVVESAIASGQPVSPNTKMIYIMFIVGGLAIPIAIAFLMELLNDKVNARSDIEKLTQTPIIGEVGHSEEADLPLVMKNNSRKFIAEQFRIIRTNMQYVIGKIDKPVIIVTSTFSGEGKSFVSTNLGGVLALAGKRTLLMEFDIRKPKVAAALGIHTRKGITNFIVGNASLDDLIVAVDDVAGLYVLPCGPVPPNPAELLLSPAINELFTYARKNFDAVIVDTAPVGVVSDALILGDLADSTVYIVRQGYTYKKQIDFIEDMYKQKKLPRQSIIINDIKHARGYGGYYGYGYGYATGKKNNYFDEQKSSLFKFFGRAKKH